MHKFVSKAKPKPSSRSFYLFTSNANFSLLSFEIIVWKNRKLRKSPSLKNFFLWLIVIYFCLQQGRQVSGLFFSLLPDLYSHFAIYFWLLQVLFWGFELQSNTQKNTKKIMISNFFQPWFFVIFFCRICCSLKKGRILTSKGPDHGWLCQQHTTWLQASRFPSCKFFVHNWVLYLWSFRERGKDLPEWHHRPNRPCCLACCCHGLQHGLGLESWSWIEKESLRLKRPRRPKSSSCWWINHLKTNDELL